MSEEYNGIELLGHSGDRFLHHRLLATIDYGFEGVKDEVIHHKNGIPWDNRRENIIPMSRAQHIQEHMDEIIRRRW